MPSSVQKLLHSKAALDELAVRIEDDYTQAQGAHKRRMKRFAEAFRRWRNRIPPPAAGEEEASNFQVPLVQWHTMGLWARHLQALLGDEAEVVAAPVGPSDHKIVHKVGRFQTWRAFHSMQIALPLATFEFRRVLFGRSHAYSPYKRDTYVTLAGGRKKRVVAYEGPGFDPMWPDDLVVPAEDVQTVQEFSYVLRKLRLAPAELLRGEVDGRYFGIRKQWETIWAYARGQGPRDGQDDEVKEEKDESEGVIYQGASQSRGTNQAWEWYGKLDPDMRTGYEPEVVITYLPEMHQIMGVQDLVEMYPQSRERRPFVESSLIPSGEYWPMGVEELLESIEDEATTAENNFTEAVQFSIGPLVFYKPSSGINPKTLKYEPFTMQPSEDPGGIKVVQPTIQPAGYQAKQQSTLAMAERVTGMSDMAMGRTSDRPNAPRTATGQLALLEQGNVRIGLNLMVMREDWSKILNHFWELDCQFTPESVFFRVTEEDAKGLFTTTKGGAYMTAKEFAGRYDFRIKFANSVWSREAEKERQIQLYSLDLGNPLVVNNPKALWMVTQKVHRALGDPNFADLLPEPADLGNPKNPKEEWNLALQGEDIMVHPLDNDDQHMIDHVRRLRAMYQERPEDRDEEAITRVAAHVVDHRHQRAAKAMVQAMAQSMSQALQGTVAQPEQPGGEIAQPQPGLPIEEPGVPQL
jgi:hypothetical protein